MLCELLPVHGAVRLSTSPLQQRFSRDRGSGAASAVLGRSGKFSVAVGGDEQSRRWSPTSKPASGARCRWRRSCRPACGAASRGRARLDRRSRQQTRRGRPCARRPAPRPSSARMSGVRTESSSSGASCFSIFPSARRGRRVVRDRGRHHDDVGIRRRRTHRLAHFGGAANAHELDTGRRHRSSSDRTRGRRERPGAPLQPRSPYPIRPLDRFPM